MRPRLPAAHRVGNPEGHAALEHITPHRQLRVLLAQPRQLRALALAQLPVPALPAAPVSIDPVSQGPRVHPQVPGHLRDRLARLADQPHRALPEVPIELPACLSHRRYLPLRGSLHAGRGNPRTGHPATTSSTDTRSSVVSASSPPAPRNLTRTRPSWGAPPKGTAAYCYHHER